MSRFNVELRMPRYVVVGDSAMLQCDYNVKKEQLHRVEWQKNGKKIFQFVQGRTPPFLNYSIPGAELDVSSNDIFKKIRRNHLDATNSDLLVIISISTCFRHLYASGRQHSPHNAHILPPDSPASQQLQQDRQL